MAREQRRLAAIIAADVVGYSRLMGRDESGTLARLREHRRERFEPTLARHGGRLVKLTGDGALAEFPSAVDALGAAIGGVGGRGDKTLAFQLLQGAGHRRLGDLNGVCQFDGTAIVPEPDEMVQHCELR